MSNEFLIIEHLADKARRHARIMRRLAEKLIQQPTQEQRERGWRRLAAAIDWCPPLRHDEQEPERWDDLA